jgi:hypothetical protein
MLKDTWKQHGFFQNLVMGPAPDPLNWSPNGHTVPVYFIGGIKIVIEPIPHPIFTQPPS